MAESITMEFIKNNNKKVGIRNLGIPYNFRSHNICKFFDMGNKNIQNVNSLPRLE